MMNTRTSLTGYAKQRPKLVYSGFEHGHQESLRRSDFTETHDDVVNHDDENMHLQLRDRMPSRLQNVTVMATM